MPGFDPLTLAAAHMALSLRILPVDLSMQCPLQGEVAVDVQLARKENPVDTSLTSVQLTQLYGHNPDSSLATDGKWMVSGVTVLDRGDFSATTQAGFQEMRRPSDGAACFAVDKIVYTINYSPKVYIASDYTAMGCRSSATRLHEQRHVDADVDTITDYIPAIKSALENYAPTLGAQGPYDGGQVDTEKQRVLKQINDMVKPQWDELLALRRQRQAAIDTIQTYMRDTALCPGQFPKFDGNP